MFDVAIVGAGPAGCWAARQLALSGARVAIFDDSHPREKPCGGGVTARALELLKPALDRRGAALEMVSVAGALFEGTSAVARVPLSNGRGTGSSLAIVSRAVFDAILLDEARLVGAIHLPERVIGIDVSNAAVRLETRRSSHRARFLLGADGANSFVRRRLASPFPRAHLSIAAGVFLHGVSGSDIVIRCVDEPPGYIWAFPRPDHLAVGICAQADATTSSRLRDEVRRWIRRTASLPGAARSAAPLPYSWPIPSLAPEAFTGQIIAGDRWALVGDAAGLVDPLTREGIFFALRSADLAAAALSGPQSSPGRRYQDAIAGTLYPELRRAAFLKRRFFAPAFTDLMVEGLIRSRRVQRVMADLIEGRQPYIGLGRRLLGTGEAALAAQLMWRALLGRLG